MPKLYNVDSHSVTVVRNKNERVLAKLINEGQNDNRLIIYTDNKSGNVDVDVSLTDRGFWALRKALNAYRWVTFE